MSGKPVIPREQAKRDIEASIDHYLNQAGETAAFKFIDALERAYLHISRHPASGPPRYAHELDMPGLRCWPLNRYPFLIFYVEREVCLDIWRVLQAERDVPAWMRDAGSG